jgi:hypothetical protein
VNQHAERDADREETQDRDDDHLADVEPGAGCTEIWEHLSERRENHDDEE